MNRNATSGTDSSPLDLAGLILIASVALVCAVLALLGWSLAGQALPFLAGALVSDSLVVLAVRLPRYRTPLVIAALMLVTAGLVLSFNLTVGWGTGFPVRLPWEVPSVVERFAFGVLLGFGGLVLSLVVSPTLDAPRTWGEAVGQRRELVRMTLIIGGVLLAFLVLAALVVGALALIAYAVAAFSG